MVIQTYLAYKYGSQPVAVSWDDSSGSIPDPPQTWDSIFLESFHEKNVLFGDPFFPDFPMDQTLGFKSFDSRKRCSQSSPIILDCITPYHNQRLVFCAANAHLEVSFKKLATPMN